MAFVFQRRLAIPLWAIAFLAVALTAPPTTVLAIAAVGIAAIVFVMVGSIPWLRTSRTPVRVVPSRHRERPSTAITLAAGTAVRTLDEPNRNAADDALDLVRMDDDGGWQMPRDRRRV